MEKESDSDSDGDDRRGGSGGDKGGSSGGKDDGGYNGGYEPPDQHFNYNIVGGGTGVGTIHNDQYIYWYKDWISNNSY